MVKSKKSLSLIICLAVICLACLIALPLVSTAQELPGVDKLFDGEGVTFTKEATDGKTDEKGLLLTATEAGASASFKLDLNEPLHINLKTLSGSAPKFHIEITDVFGQTFSIHSVYKTSYDNISVELNGKQGGIYRFSDKWDMLTGYTAAYNTSTETYTQFWRTYSKEDRNDLQNPVTADADCLHLEFDPAKMTVGIKRFAPDPYITVWDLSKETNDGYNIGSKIDFFGDYTFKIVFDEVKNNDGKILIYSVNDYDLSRAALAEGDKQISIAVPLLSNAQIGKQYIFPKATVKTLEGSAAAAVTSVDGANCPSYIPASGDKLTVAYTSGGFTRELTIPVVAASTSGLDSANIPSHVGVSQRIELPLDEITTNLSYFKAPAAVSVSVKDGAGAEVTLENGSFVASKADTYTVTYAALNGAFTKQFIINASAAETGINYPQLAKVYTLGQTVSVSPASVSRNGAALKVVTTVEFPSGKTAPSGEILLDETGNYTVIHTYGDNGEYTFTQSLRVGETADDLFSADENIDISYGTVTGNNDLSGVKLTFNGNRTVEYQKIIDLSDNRFDTDTNTGDLLLELVAQPMTVGTADMEKIELFFTDVNDESNVMSVSLAYFPASQTVTKIHAKGPGQTYTARRANGEITIVTDAGFNSRHSFIQTVRHDGSTIDGEFWNYTLKLYYDYEENALYATPEWNKDSYLVIDFDDPTMFPTNPWSGFSDGQVKLSVKVSGVASTADVYVLNIDGSTFDGEYFEDTKAPIIQPNISGNAPLAAVNTPYPLISFDALDLQSGISEKWWEVTDRNGADVTLQNNTFTPTYEGIYTVTLYAKDFFGNVASESVTVTAVPYVAGVVLTVDGTVPENVFYGQYVELPGYSVDSGAGMTTVTVTVTNGGEKIPVDDFKFFVDREGTYIITYKAADYIGNTNYKSFFVNASLGTAPSIDQSKISLPMAFIHNEKYVFDDYKASFYPGAGGTEELISARITVTDAKGTYQLDGREYTPVVVNGSTTVDTIKVKFVFQKQGGKPLEVEKTVNAVNPVAAQGYMSDYFIVDNGTAKAFTDGILFDAASAEDMEIKYIRPLNTRSLSVKFLTNGYVTEQLSDDDVADLVSALVGEGKRYATLEALDADLEKKVVDANGAETDEYVGVTHDGTKYYKIRRYYLKEKSIVFDNFSSISITLRDSRNPSEQATVTYQRNGTGFVSNVCGKTAVTGTNSIGEFFLRYDNETNVISDANNTKLGTLTVNDTGKQFYGFSSGSVYVTIKVSGISGDCSMLFKQMNNHAFNDNASDNITPVLWLNGTVDGRYKIGSTALIPSADAYDVLNAIAAPTVTITAPDGNVLLQDGPADIEYKLTFGQYGTYMVVYTAKDGAGNFITITKSLLVSDDRAPELTIDGSIAETAKVGDTFTLPTYTVSDNDTASVKVDITLRKPNGQYDLIKDGSVTFDEAGRYTVHYFVIDSDRNTSIYTYSIVVTE